METLGTDTKTFVYKDRSLTAEWRILGPLRCWVEGHLSLRDTREMLAGGPSLHG